MLLTQMVMVSNREVSARGSYADENRQNRIPQNSVLVQEVPGSFSSLKKKINFFHTISVPALPFTEGTMFSMEVMIALSPPLRLN